jgi:hypothetical protein
MRAHAWIDLASPITLLSGIFQSQLGLKLTRNGAGYIHYPERIKLRANHGANLMSATSATINAFTAFLRICLTNK